MTLSGIGIDLCHKLKFSMTLYWFVGEIKHLPFCTWLGYVFAAAQSLFQNIRRITRHKGKSSRTLSYLVSNLKFEAAHWFVNFFRWSIYNSVVRGYSLAQLVKHGAVELIRYTAQMEPVSRMFHPPAKCLSLIVSLPQGIARKSFYVKTYVTQKMLNNKNNNNSNNSNNNNRTVIICTNLYQRWALTKHRITLSSNKII